MMKSLGRWKAIILGFVFLIVSQLVENVLTNEILQIIVNCICVVGALISFAISTLTDDKLKFKNAIKNKWIIFSLMLSVIFFVFIIAVSLK